MCDRLAISRNYSDLAYCAKITLGYKYLLYTKLYYLTLPIWYTSRCQHHTCRGSLHPCEESRYRSVLEIHFPTISSRSPMTELAAPISMQKPVFRSGFATHESLQGKRSSPYVHQISYALGWPFNENRPNLLDFYSSA